MAANEISLLQQSALTVDEAMNKNDDIEFNIPDESMILARLNELRQWQESQRKMLAESQLDQQKMLQLEKQKLYAMFGISAEEVSVISLNDDADDDDDGPIEKSYNFQSNQNVHDFNETPKVLRNENLQPIGEKPLELHSPSIKQLQKIMDNIALRSPNHKDQHPNEIPENIPKRPYLKRGEGLKNRFKISPDAFRLDKLPKYKYAQRMQKHAQSTLSRKQRHQEITTNDTIISSAAEGVVDNTTSEGRQNNTKDACIAKSHKTKNENNCNLKPTTKRPSPHRTLQLKLKPNATKNAHKTKSSNDVNQFLHVYSQDAFEREKVEQPILPVKRPNLLSPATKPLLDTPTRQRLQFQQDEINDLKQFVQLEQDFNSNNSGIDMDKAKRDDNLVFKFKMGLNVSPKHLIVNRNFGDIEEEDEENLEQSLSSESGDESKHVHFKSNAIAIEKVNHCRETSELSAMSLYDSVPNTSSPNEKSTESFQKFKEKLFDRRLKQKFQNRLSVAKDFEISDLNSNKSDCDDDESTLATAIDFNDTEGFDPKNKLIQERLLSLEKEIHSFREQNNELTKLIREHELIRLTFDEERRAERERIEDERVKFERYMHEHRLKMLDEKTKWEKKTKESRGLTQSEKDELARLRDKCANHETELSAREQKHVAAQGRIRAQLRNVEKDLKEVRNELENLQRENKKLETENIRLRRQSNDKILTEINKSISKLAHSTEYLVNDNRFEDENNGTNDRKIKHGVKKCSNKNAHKTVVAKVTSHREPSSHGNHLRSKSVPNLPHSESNEKFYELCSQSSECENSESSSQCNGIDVSRYFGTSKIDRARDVDNEQYVNTEQYQFDESDNLSTSMKRIIENPDGSKDVWYPNGNLKKISADGMCIRMLYFNKDIKETDINEGTVKYYYAENNTWQTTYLDGLEIFEYPDGQTEHRFKDGKVEIHFPNGSVRMTDPVREQKEGIKEEWKYADGTSMIQMTNGERMLLLMNGQREVHANGHKRREYPDGTVKIVYPDGSQETRYSNGRVRLKNKDGKLIMDSETISI